MAEVNATQELDVEELKKKLAAAEKRAAKAEKKIAEAEAEAEEAKERAEASATAAANEAAAGEKTTKAILDAEEKVEIRLFKDNDQYKDDLVVGINGYMYKIQRGVPVLVPKSVAEAVRNSEMQDQAAADMMERIAGKAAEPALQ